MRKLARAVIIHPDGSGKKADALGYLVGGKTGTAELVSRNGGFKKNSNLASFVAAFPINKPKFLVLVLIEEPKPQIEKLNQENLQPPRKSKKWYHRAVKDIMTREGIK